MATSRTNQLTIASTTLALLIRDGVRQIRTQRGRYSEEDSRPFTTFVPLGYAGMGMSAEHDRGRDQHDYTIDMDVDHYNRTKTRMQLGLEQNTIDLSGVTGLGNITRISEVATDASGNMYVYLAGVGAFLPKIRLDTMALIGSTKEFTHGVTDEVISDICVVKSGSDNLTIGDPRNVTQVGDGVLMVAFGRTACIAQADSVATNLTDTWTVDQNGGGTGNAYGGFLCKTQGATNTETLVWKSSGIEGSGYINGAYCRLMNYTVSTSTTAVFYPDHDNWSPATPVQVGDFGTSITGMTEYGRGLVVAKPEGVFAFDTNYNNAPLATFRGYLHDVNGRSITSWLDTLAFQTRRDISTPQGLIGITQLVSNLSPVQGHVTALCAWGDRLFAAYYDGTDTYIVMLKRRSGESAENPYIIWGVTKLASKVCYAMRVITRANGDTILLYGNSANLGWMILDPVGSRKYASSGQYFSPRIGDPGKPFILESLNVFVKTAGANVNFTPSIITDDTTTTAYTAWTSAGRKTLTLTAGTADTGTTYQLKIVANTNSNATTPVLMGGGFYVRGHYTGVKYDQLVIVVHNGTWSASGVGSDGATVFATLKGYEGTLQNITYLDYFGDASAHKMQVDEVSYIEGPGESPQGSERYIEIKLRMPASSS